MNEQCYQCRDLWEEYGAAVMAHTKLDNKLKLAALTGDSATIRMLRPLTEKSGAARKLLRDTIRMHDLQVHDEAASAG
jgi:hypothetical protein